MKQKKIEVFLLIAILILGKSMGHAQEVSYPVIASAGDIASCESGGDEKTSALLDKLIIRYPNLVIAPLGDFVYYKGTYQDFINCFNPSWGRHKSRMRPAPGNHEYKTDGASGYFGYFDEVAGDPNKGYYSYELGLWHVVVLNTGECAQKPELCDKGSLQVQWLRADLTEHKSRCTLVYFHHPLFTSGVHYGEDGFVSDIWKYLQIYNVDVVLTGHDHGYERFPKLDERGKKDILYGVRQFVVGTGGANLTPFRTERIHLESEVRNDTDFGVLLLKLKPTSFE